MSQIVRKRPSQTQGNADQPAWGVVISLDRARTARKQPPVLGSRAPKPCGHERHVGWCPDCQRAQLARWRSQLASVEG
jgi:hypothetical protein